MKNIHVIPTDKPSRLFYSKEFEFFKIANKYDVWREGRNIYITSDEEIKEGDWFLWQGYGGEWFKEKCEYMLYEGKKTKHLNCNYKTQFKVILTTDLDLIADGVQSITDEFLEWFVKNPSCEMVEVKKDEFYSKKAFIEGKDAITFKYKIIIPKEELHSMDDEVECNMCGGYMYLLPDNSMYVCTNSECTRCYEEEDEEPEQETLEDFINLETDTFGIGKNHIPKEEQKQHLIDLMRLDEQETLEEAAEKWNEKQTTLEFGKPYNAPNRIKAFIEGVKWQQEQDKNKYSEKEVLEQLNLLMSLPSSTLDKFTDDNGNITIKWFEQFKKK
jgi:hypothetical protein